MRPLGRVLSRATPRCSVFRIDLRCSDEVCYEGEHLCCHYGSGEVHNPVGTTQARARGTSTQHDADVCGAGSNLAGAGQQRMRSGLQTASDLRTSADSGSPRAARSAALVLAAPCWRLCSPCSWLPSSLSAPSVVPASAPRSATVLAGCVMGLRAECACAVDYVCGSTLSPPYVAP